MGREYGQYRKMLLEQQVNQKSGNCFPVCSNMDEYPEFSWTRIRFYISLILFVCYMLWDYTKISIQNITSDQLLALIQEDQTDKIPFSSMAFGWMDQISITEGQEAVEEADKIQK